MRSLLAIVLLAACAAPPQVPFHSASQVVVVQTDQGYGSGFVVRQEDGSFLVATCEHVVEDGTVFTLIVPSSIQAIEGGSVELANKEADVALVRFPGVAPTEVLPLAEQPPQPGSFVYAAGYPLSGLLRVTQGIFSVPPGTMSAPVAGGNSGGPVLNQEGEVVGIAAAMLSQGFGPANFASEFVPVAELRALLQRVASPQSK